MSSINVSVALDAATYARARAVLSPAQYTIAMQAAISDTIRTGKAQVARIVVENVHMKVGDVKRLITTKKSSFAKLEGIIAVSRKSVDLGSFPSTQLKKGVKVRIWKDQKGELLRSTFKLAKGRNPIYERKLTAGPKSKRVGRLPLLRRKGPSAVGVIVGNRKRGGIGDDIVLDLSETLAKNVRSQIDRVLRNPESIAKQIPLAQRAIDSR